MKHLTTYKLFEDSSEKLIDKYYKEADDLRSRFQVDITEIENRFTNDVNDCMHELTDHSEWIFRDEYDGPFYRYYIVRIPLSDWDEFVKAMNDSLTKLENHLGVKYMITYVNGQHDIGDLSEFNKSADWYKEKFRGNTRKAKAYKTEENIVFKIYIGDTKDR